MVDTLQLVKTVVADGNSATMDTGTLTGDLDVLRVVVEIEGGGSGGCRMRFNSDTGSNYRRLFSENGGSKDGHGDGASNAISNMVGRTGRRSYSINTIYNISGKETSGYGHCITDGGNTGSANAPTRMEYAFKWANTAQITSIQIISDSTSWASGSTLNVYAYSRADEEISDEKTTLADATVTTDSPSTTTTTTSGATQQGAQSGSNQTTAHVTSGSNTGLKFTSTHNGTGAAVGTFDLGSALASKWIAQVSFTTGSSYTSAGNGMFAFGISDKSTYSSSETMNTNSSGDTVNWIWHLGASNDRKQRIRTILNGSGSDGTQGTSRAWENSTTFYFEFKYDGTTVTAQRKTDDTYATNHSQSAVTKATSGITGLQYFNWGSTDDGGSQGGFNVTLNTLKIYDGVSSLDGCKNDFSSTSDLEALSGVRTNSIFQQSAENGATPSYWWYSGSAWLLDGTTQIIPTGTWNSSGYTNHSSFTQDSGKITYTCSAGNGQNGGAVASYDLGSGFDGDTNFIFRFRIKYTNQSDVSQANTSFSVGIGKEKTMTSSQGIFDSTDQIMWRWAGANNDEYRILTNVDGSNYQSSGQSFTPSTDTYYYFEIVRSGATSFTMNRYSDDTYKTVSDSESTTSAGNPNSLRYIQMGTSYDHQIGSWVAEVDEMKIQSGVSEWLE